MFNIDFNPLIWILPGLALLLAVWCVWRGLRPQWNVTRLPGQPDDSVPVDEQSEEMPDEAAEEAVEENPESAFPGVSVIVHGSEDREPLEAFLKQMDFQNYPDFEVIVVLETHSREIMEWAGNYEVQYPWLHVTFMLSGAKGLSRHKLALTIGMKAAKKDVIVTTSVHAVIPSENWLRNLMMPYAEKGVDVVLGYSRLDFRELHGPWKWYGQFDGVMTDSQWIGYAAAGEPYRGDGNNLAFRRKTFFDHKGYARTIHLNNGEDDIFLKEICNGENTRVVVDPSTIVTISWGRGAHHLQSLRKERYAFTQRWLPKGPFLRAGAVSASQWLVLLLVAAGAIIGLPSLIPAIAGAVVLLAFWGCEIALYRSTAKRLEAVRLWWAVVPFMLVKPIVNMFFRMSMRRTGYKNYTYQCKTPFNK